MGTSPVRTVELSRWACIEHHLAFKEQLMTPERHKAFPSPGGPKTNAASRPKDGVCRPLCGRDVSSVLC